MNGDELLTGARAMSASERLAQALGRPLPPPMTAEQRADWEARQDAADDEATRIYGTGARAA